MASRRRGFGRVRRLPSGRYQAGYLGPDLALHNALDTFHTREDAEAWLSRERELTHSDAWRPVQVRAELARRQPVTLESFAEAWLGSRTLTPRTHALYRSLLDRFILPELGEMPLKDLSPAVVRAWHAKVTPNRPTQRAHAYSLLRAICSTAVMDEVLVANPCRVAGAGSARRVRRIVPPTLPEVEILVRSMPEPYQLLVLLAAWCGLRLGELIELRRKDVDCRGAGAPRDSCGNSRVWGCRHRSPQVRRWGAQCACATSLGPRSPCPSSAARGTREGVPPVPVGERSEHHASPPDAL